MRIIVENENEEALITDLCDMALRAGGLKNKEPVDMILKSIVNETVEVPEEKE